MSAKRQLKEEFKTLFQEMADNGIGSAYLNRLEHIVGEMRRQSSAAHQEALDLQASNQSLTEKVRQLSEQFRDLQPRVDEAEQRHRQAEARFQMEHIANQTLAQKKQKVVDELAQCQRKLEAAEQRPDEVRAQLKNTRAQLAACEAILQQRNYPHYDTEMIRDFLNHLTASLRYVINQHVHDGNADADLEAQLKPYVVKYQTAFLLKTIKGDLDPQTFVEQVRCLHNGIRVQREQQLTVLLHLCDLMDEALECAAHPGEPLADTWRYQLGSNGTEWKLETQ